MTDLPADISLEFAPTPQTLLATWGKCTQEQLDTGWRTEPVYQRWVLASEGELGLREIQKGLADEFLAAVPFQSILDASRLMEFWEKSPKTWIEKLGLGGVPAFRLLKTPDGGSRWVFGDKAPDAYNVVLVGEMADFDAMKNKGQEILDHALYDEIVVDSRPVSPGHPEEWFNMVRSPTTWGPVRTMLGFGPGAENGK